MDKPISPRRKQANEQAQERLNHAGRELRESLKRLDPSVFVTPAGSNVERAAKHFDQALKEAQTTQELPE